MELTFLFSDILLADLDTDFVMTARMALQTAGYTVRRAVSGQAVLEAAAAQSPDLLLLSAILPDMDVCDVIRRLKADRMRRLLPIIVLTEGQSDAAAALNAGADEFLSKPVSHAELLVRVRAMLRLKRTTDALADLNETLERKVAARTQALEEAHARMRHSEKLSALGRLAASVAHDINNPLSAILSYLYLLKYELPNEAALREDISIIERQVEVIAELVRRLQNFSRPPKTTRLQINVTQVLDDVVKLIGKDLQKRKIELEYAPMENLPPILAAPDQISEVVMNLLVNARDAMPEGGALKVTVFWEAGYVGIRVSDTGGGIPPEIKERIFEPFFTTKGEQGTGLGLAICSRIVTEHGGDITVESTPGAGTTFTVRLPVAGAEEGG